MSFQNIEKNETITIFDKMAKLSKFPYRFIQKNACYINPFITPSFLGLTLVSVSEGIFDPLHQLNFYNSFAKASIVPKLFFILHLSRTLNIDTKLQPAIVDQIWQILSQKQVFPIKAAVVNLIQFYKDCAIHFFF